MDAVVAYGNLQRSAWTLLCAAKSGEGIVYQDMTSVAEGDGIRARLVVGYVRQLHLAPCLTAVVTVGCGEPTVACACQNLKTTVGMTKNGGLDAVDGFDV